MKGEKRRQIFLTDLLFVPQNFRNLISVFKLRNAGVEVRFGAKCDMETTDGTIFPLKPEGNLFVEYCK